MGSDITEKGSGMEEKKWPRIGDRLVHRFRGNSGEVVAEVVGSDRKTGRIAVRIGKRQYESLSAAAQAISGNVSNGWVYWGLKKQKGYGPPP